MSEMCSGRNYERNRGKRNGVLREHGVPFPTPASSHVRTYVRKARAGFLGMDAIDTYWYCINIVPMSGGIRPFLVWPWWEKISPGVYVAPRPRGNTTVYDARLSHTPRAKFRDEFIRKRGGGRAHARTHATKMVALGSASSRGELSKRRMARRSHPPSPLSSKHPLEETRPRGGCAVASVCVTPYGSVKHQGHSKRRKHTCTPTYL